MKPFTIKLCLINRGLGALALILGLGALTAPSAMAYKVYQLEDKYYAIVCADGQIFSYSGGAGGLSTVGPALCETHGGVAGGDDGRPQVERAPADVARIGKRCEKAGQEVRDGVKQCPGKVRVRRDNPNAEPQQQAPGQDYNSSRSNKPTS